jgi:hypothetical protein
MTVVAENLRHHLDNLASIIRVRDGRSLRFLGALRRKHPPKDWVLVLSSDQLSPENIEDFRYADKALKEAMPSNESPRIWQVVILSHDKGIIPYLLEHGEDFHGFPPNVHPIDEWDEVIIAWPPRSQAA